MRRPEQTSTPPLTTTEATCQDGRSVKLITVAGAGHEWLGSSRKSADSLDATTVIWQFFASRGDLVKER